MEVEVDARAKHRTFTQETRSHLKPNQVVLMPKFNQTAAFHSPHVLKSLSQHAVQWCRLTCQGRCFLSWLSCCDWLSARRSSRCLKTKTSCQIRFDTDWSDRWPEADSDEGGQTVWLHNLHTPAVHTLYKTTWIETKKTTPKPTNTQSAEPHTHTYTPCGLSRPP